MWETPKEFSKYLWESRRFFHQGRHRPQPWPAIFVWTDTEVLPPGAESGVLVQLDSVSDIGRAASFCSARRLSRNPTLVGREYGPGGSVSARGCLDGSSL